MVNARRLHLAAVAVLFAILSLIGHGWGLPGGHWDPFLFGYGPPMSGQALANLAKPDEKFDPSRGADVDVDPIGELAPLGSRDLTASSAEVAAIIRRYRLYTHQPDEMITMMALAGMQPHKLQFDPRLYQYGGLFIYPIGLLLKACAWLSWIDLRNDLTFYFDNPDEFAKFYLVARAYSAAWGVVAVFVVFSMARRLGGDLAGLLAAGLFTLLPVVICMAHEAKPHLPGAVLMLLAVRMAMWQLDVAKSYVPATIEVPGGVTSGSFKMKVLVDPENPTDVRKEPDGVDFSWGHIFPERSWFYLCVCCGAATGMVLSSMPILILIPLIAFLEKRQWWPTPRRQGGSEPLNLAATLGVSNALKRTPLRIGLLRSMFGLMIAVAAYFFTNPYVAINALTNRAVLRSNFGNSLAMYEIDRVGEGFIRVLALTVEGATFPILVLGVLGAAAALLRKRGDAWPLALPAVVFFLQFVLIGAGKPGEYGRFGIFTNSALAIGTACLLSGILPKSRIAGLMLTIAVSVWVSWGAGTYLWNFHVDSGAGGSRMQLARMIAEETERAIAAGEPAPEIAVLREPAPYCCPPLDFRRNKVTRYRSVEEFGASDAAGRSIFLDVSETPRSISWANKPFQVIHTKGQRPK